MSYLHISTYVCEWVHFFPIIFKAPPWFWKIYDRLYQILCVNCLMFFFPWLLHCFFGTPQCAAVDLAIKSFRSRFSHAFGIQSIQFENDLSASVHAWNACHFYAYYFLIYNDIRCQRWFWYKHTRNELSLIIITMMKALFCLKILFSYKIVSSQNFRRVRECFQCRFGNRFVESSFRKLQFESIFKLYFIGLPVINNAFW